MRERLGVEYAGQEQEGQHTLGHLECPECARVCQEAMHSGNFGTYLFPHAANIWLGVKAHAVSPGMTRDYKDAIKALTKFFAFIKLEDVHIGHVQVYQKSRQVKVGASRINKEIVTLGQIMAVAGLWQPIKKYYKPLPVPLSIGMALEPEEEEYLFQLAHKKKEWLVCYCASLLTNATTAGPGELRHLQVKDIDLKARVMHVRRGVKNRFRVRVLPLNDDAAWAADQLLNRYRAMCTKYHIAEDPNHYILYHRGAKSKRTGRKPNPGGKPGIDKAQKLSWESRTCPYCQGRFATSFRLEGHIKADHPEIPQAPSEPKPMPDPTRPMGVWRSAWESLRKELAKKYPHLAKLRRYDLRHNAATKMLEDPSLSERVVEEMLGHKINSQIKDRYSHIRLERKWKAAQVLEGHHVPPPEPPPQIPSVPTPNIMTSAHGFGVVNGGKVVAMPERKPWH